MQKVPSLKNAGLNERDSKRTYNRVHFAEAAPRYDFATKILSFGGDAVWKQKLIEALPDDAESALDLACGTGDICFLLAERFRGIQIEGIDLTQEMLDIATHRNTFGNQIRFVQGDLCQLPQAGASFDLVTGSYALRNAPNLKICIEEIYRVLTPGGTAAFLDFSKAPSRVSQKVQYGLLRFWGGLWGVLLHGNPAVHGYISESLKTYPTRPELDTLFIAMGFEKISSRLFYGGMTEIFLFRKPVSSQDMK
jgi:ubiquinone/menaquinone biosynthesis methyltransferase